MNLIQQMLTFIRNPYNQYGQHTHDFLVLCLTAIIAAIVISVPLGVLAAQNRVIAFIAANLTGLARAIPVIAFFFVAVTYLNLGVGFKPAVIALILLGIPPVLLNTVAGLNGIDPAVVDAARGMGMSWWQRLTRVQLPLVLPVIAAGARTSAVQIVATAPLSAIIAGGGYGDYIFSGLDLFNTAEVLVGAIPVIILALAAEYGMAAAERALTPRALKVTAATGEAASLAA
jgi:osmoprotectant transport system permease protein